MGLVSTLKAKYLRGISGPTKRTFLPSKILFLILPWATFSISVNGSMQPMCRGWVCWSPNRIAAKQWVRRLSRCRTIACLCGSSTKLYHHINKIDARFTCQCRIYEVILLCNRWENYYRPQRSCGQGYVFTRVCDSVNGGVSASVHAGMRTPPLEQTPPREQTPPIPPEQTPLEQTPLREQTPPREADSGIRSMSGRYASYWNAFLLLIFLLSYNFVLW